MMPLIDNTKQDFIILKSEDVFDFSLGADFLCRYKFLNDKMPKLTSKLFSETEVSKIESKVSNFKLNLNFDSDVSYYLKLISEFSDLIFEEITLVYTLRISFEVLNKFSSVRGFPLVSAHDSFLSEVRRQGLKNWRSASAQIVSTVNIGTPRDPVMPTEYKSILCK